MVVAFDPALAAPRRVSRQVQPRRHLSTEPQPSHLQLLPSVDPLLSRRDDDLIRRFYPWLTALVDHYYRGEVEGSENLTDRASLFVSTHNGGMYTPDAYCLMLAFWRRFGIETPAYGLMHRIAFRVPGLGPLLTRLGAVPASRENAATVLRHDHPLLVCPGGDLDALKPFSQRHRIIFGGRTGFVATAIANQVPIVPIISVGAHETVLFLNDGRWLARVSGFARFLRIKTVPFALSFPLGVTIAGLGAIPLPSKITVRVLPKIELAEPPTAAADPAVLRRCYDHVVATMQASLDDLASRRKRVLFG
jgi:1-acyl-sn-glycerol-3-phosphate acyltransferase